MKVSAQYAEEHFADIFHAAEAVRKSRLLALTSPPIAYSFLKPDLKPAPKTTPSRQRRELLGELEGKVKTLTDAEWKAANKEFEALVLNSLGISSVAK